MIGSAAGNLLERDLWLLAMCWRAGSPLHWHVVQQWIEYLVRVGPIGARA